MSPGTDVTHSHQASLSPASVCLSSRHYEKKKQSTKDQTGPGAGADPDGSVLVLDG